MKKCTECGALNDPSSKFCTECGALIPDEIVNENAEVAIVDEISEETADETFAAETEETADETFAAETEETADEPFAAETEEATDEPFAADEDLPKKGEHTVKGRTFGIIGFIIGLEALLTCLVPCGNFAALIYAIICLIFCHVSKNNTRFRLTKVAKVFGILALIFSLVTIVLYGILAYLGIRALIDSPYIEDFMNQISTYLSQFDLK